MYRVVVFKSTGKLIPGQMQSGGDTHPDPGIDDAQYAAKNLQVMIDNAVASGYKKKDIDAKFVTDEEWAQIQANNDPSLDFGGQRVRTKADVDRITAQRIADLGEDKAKTEKLLAGIDDCPVWDEFIAARAAILQEGENFIAASKLQ
jgi:hypothetical protein